MCSFPHDFPAKNVGYWGRCVDKLSPGGGGGEEWQKWSKGVCNGLGGGGVVTTEKGIISTLGDQAEYCL